VRAAARRSADGTATLLVAQRDTDVRVRRAATEAFASRDGAAAVEALATSLADTDPEVVSIAARGLAARPSMPRTREALLSAYGGASRAGRAAIADALESVGTSLREAVELEARALWERNLAALAGRGPERAGAAEELGASARADAVARLLPLLDPKRNPDRVLAAAAARGLGEAGDVSVRRKLEILLEEPDADLAEAAADALGRLGDPTAADALAASAVSGAGRIASAAVEALAQLPQAPEVGLSLCEVALRTVNPGVAAAAGRAAREREAECPVRPLLTRLGQPGTAAALAALAVLRVPEAEVATRVIPLLDPARAPDLDVRIAALRVLGTLRSPAAAAAVRERTNALKARAEAARARWVRGRLPEARLAGIERAGDERLTAVLGRAPGSAPGTEPGEPVLPAFIPPPAAGLTELGAALREVGRAHAAGAEVLLLEAVSDPDPAVRAGAFEGLAALGSPKALGPATAGISDPDHGVRTAAASALWRAGPAGAAVLFEAVGKPGIEAEWCATLTRALGDSGMHEAVPALARQLGGPCGAAAAQALGRIGTPAAAPPLAEALARPDASGRVEMVEALAQVGSTVAVGILTRELTSDRPQVRAAAARALALVRHEPAASRLEALRSDYYGRVRRAAVEALAKLPAGPSTSR
jgi:HEAT repeat protein